MDYSVVSATEAPYEVLGEISIPSLFFEGMPENVIKVSTLGGSLFYNWAEYTRTGDYPEMKAETVAFRVRLISNATGRVVNGFDAIITEILSYNINPVKGTVDLSFRFRRAGETDEIIPKINPVINHIYHEGDFIALYFEGAEDAIMAEVNKMSAINHGGTIYYHQASTRIGMTLPNRIEKGKSDRVHLSTVVVYSSRKICSEEELKLFKETAFTLGKIFYQ